MGYYREMIILIAGDYEGHAGLIQQWLLNSGISNKIIRLSDGKEVFDFISGSGRDESRDRGKSYLLLLDINLPELNGIEVLKKIKGNEELQSIPVIIFAPVNYPEEVMEYYKAGCNIYINKPSEITELEETVKRLGLFIQIVKI